MSNIFQLDLPYHNMNKTKAPVIPQIMEADNTDIVSSLNHDNNQSNEETNRLRHTKPMKQANNLCSNWISGWWFL